MKNLLIAIVSILAISTIKAQTQTAMTAKKVDNLTAITQKTVDISTSEIEWEGRKVTGAHNGTISVKEGILDFNGSKLIGGSFVIDMTSINVTDLEGDYKGKLEGHLKSGDFFGVEENPTAAFVITKVISRGLPGEYKITGKLTIKEITKEIKFNATTDELGSMSAAITIDRTDFNVKYGSGSFFDNLGDKTIYDEFNLDVTLALK